jgi:single-strand DNA-binding protein
MNVVALRGRLARPAEQRVLPSGDRLVAYEVSVPGPEGRAETAPVVWFGAPAAAAAMDADQEVVVVGRVRRRFFQSGGTTQSRTEVVAELVLPASQAKRVAGALRGAAERVQGASEGDEIGVG